jgi:hypothetical protein
MAEKQQRSTDIAGTMQVSDEEISTPAGEFYAFGRDIHRFFAPAIGRERAY